MSITAYENLMSTAERRLLLSGDTNTCIRMGDFMGVIPAINGKIELVYEGEQEGAYQISFHLINEAIKTLFPEYFTKIEKLEKAEEKGPYDDLLGWFFGSAELFISDDLNDKEYRKLLGELTGASSIIEKHLGKLDAADHYFMIEFLIWGLEAHKKLNKYRTFEGFQFKDALGSFISGL